MTTRPSAPADPASRRIRRLVRRAGLALMIERLTERLWPLVTLLLLFTALAAFELPRRLPSLGHLALLAIFLGGLGWSLWRLRRLRRPDRPEALRRIEEDSALPHRPLTLLEDELAAGKGDPLSSTLWALSKRQAAELAPRLTVRLPRPVLPQADRLGLRFVPLLLLALAGAGGLIDASLPDRLLAAATPGLGSFAGPPPLLQAWVTPPAYTHQPPQHLQSLAPGQTVTVPAGSVLLAELQGGHGKAEVRIDDNSRAFSWQGNDSQKLEMPLTKGSKLEIRQGFSAIASWPLAVIADRPPAIAFAEPPQHDRAGRLKLEVLGHDDYGIAKLSLLMRPAGAPESEAQTLPLPLGPDASPELHLTLWQDLTGHPWAGRDVVMRLVAENGAGLKAVSAAVSVPLPERSFTNPIAQIVAALRKRLGQAPMDRSPVMAGLARVMASPGAFHDDTTVFLALSVSLARLRWDSSDAAVPSVMEILWQTALKIEEGDRPMAEKALDSVQKALEEALAHNAPAAEIARLMAQLQQALDQYMDALVQDALRHGIDGIPANPDQPTVSPQDLQDLTEQIKDLAATGSREAAQAMLRRLRDLTQGMQVVAKSQSEAQAKQAQGLLNELSSITEEQNRLLDQSFQANRRQQAADDTEEGSLPILGQKQGPRSANPSGTPSREAAGKQDALRQRLDKVMRQMSDGGLEPPQAFGQASQAMKDSSASLSQGNLPDAVDAQGEAVSRLQEGTRQTLQSLSQKMGGGLSAQPGGLPGGTDPLGRPLPNGAGGLPNLSDQPLPGQAERTKAREVLDDLRRRSGEGQRPPEERDYLQRLLKSFF